MYFLGESVTTENLSLQHFGDGGGCSVSGGKRFQPPCEAIFDGEKIRVTVVRLTKRSNEVNGNALERISFLYRYQRVPLVGSLAPFPLARQTFGYQHLDCFV